MTKRQSLTTIISTAVLVALLASACEGPFKNEPSWGDCTLQYRGTTPDFAEQQSEFSDFQLLRAAYTYYQMPNSFQPSHRRDSRTIYLTTWDTAQVWPWPYAHLPLTAADSATAAYFVSRAVEIDTIPRRLVEYRLSESFYEFRYREANHYPGLVDYRVFRADFIEFSAPKNYNFPERFHILFPIYPDRDTLGVRFLKWPLSVETFESTMEDLCTITPPGPDAILSSFAVTSTAGIEFHVYILTFIYGDWNMHDAAELSHYAIIASGAESRISRSIDFVRSVVGCYHPNPLGKQPLSASGE